MFHRRRSRARRADSLSRRRQRARQRCLSLEPLEERPLLAVMTVTSLTDDTLANLAGDGQLSLREAIEAINTAAAVDGIAPTSGVFGTDDEIQFAPGLFGGGPQTITLADVAGAQQLSLTRAMTITGPGASLLTIDAGNGTDNTFNTGDGFRIFEISDGAATNSPVTLTGLTLTGGDVTGQGGAIRSFESLTVRESVITGNAATMEAGGLFLYTPAAGGDFEITDTTISSNASGQIGGGLFALTLGSSNVLLSGNTIARNSAAAGGGAVLNLSGTTATITHNRIVDNMSTTFGGGGMVIASGATSTTTITSTTVSGNEAVTHGGGLYLYTEAGSSLTLADSTIAGNDATGNGGGIFIGAGDADVTNSTISGNEADGFGGGIAFAIPAAQTLTIRYSTITDNTADADSAGNEGGGGLYLGDNGTAVVENTIIAGNFDAANTAPDLDNTSGVADIPLTIRFSLVGDNTGSGLAAANPDADGNRIGTTAAPIDPLLGALQPNGGPTDTHRLLALSPAIDAGDPAFAVPPNNDQRGDPFIRLFDGFAPAGAVIDMGAYERQDLGAAQALVVDILEDENDGDYSPGDLSLREAIGLANGNTGISETITFAPALNGGTILLTLGQLVVNDPLTINAAALAAGITIDASGNDDDPGTDNGGGSRIFDIDDSTNAQISVTLENLTVTGGDVDAEGGGIRNFEFLTIIDSTVDGNHATGDGGGIESRTGHLTLEHTTVSQNAGDAGGGIHFDALDADLSITNSILADNESTTRGGGIGVDNADDVGVTSSTISSNMAGSRGGGIYMSDTGTSRIVSSTLSGNDANTEGGGIFVATDLGDVATIAHSTITANTSDVNDNGTGSGGGLFAITSGTLTLTHTIIAQNTDRHGLAPDFDHTLNGGATFNRTYNLIGNNLGSGLAAGNPDGNGNRIGTNAAPIFAGLGLLLDNGGPTPTHALNPASPAIDTGDPAAVAGVGGIPSFDQRGNPFTRVFDGNGDSVTTIDIGAFEVNAFELVVPDDFEPNDTLDTATVLGSPPFETIRDLSITAGNEFTPDDIDYFKYTAHYTGQLRVRIHFDDDFGNLDLEVRDMFDNIIDSSASVSDNEEIIIPVVFQEMYFIRVFGFQGDSNNYTLEVENFPAPVPTGVELDPASDTGMMDNDNVTTDDTPTIFIQTDVLNFVDTNNNGLFQDPDTAPAGTEDLLDALSPEEVERILNGTPQPQDEDGGIAVEVTFINTTDGTYVIGYAEAVIGELPEKYRFTPSAPLTPGVYDVTARTRVFDGQSDAAGDPDQATNRSNASPPLRLVIDTAGAADGTISADMLDASDTGMFDDDNVTNKMQPAFQGIAPAGSKVRIFANGELVGQGVAGSDTSDVGHSVGGIGGLENDGLGLWEITVEPLDDNGYDIRIEVEDAAGNVTEFDPRFNGDEEPIDIVVDTLEPNTPYLDLLDDTGRHDNDNITKNNMPLFSMTTTDPNAALAQLLFTDNLKFRIFDRYESTLGTPAPEVLIYDSAQDAVADATTTALDMFTSETQLSKILPFLTPASPAITAGGQLADGVHNLKLEVEDRAGNISHDFIIEITVDTETPPISFGLPDLADDTDGLTASSDSGVTTVPDTYADRVTNDTTPTFWGRAEADTIVRLYLDLNANGIIDLNTDTFLGQTTAIPFDGNDAYPDGYWEITSALDLNEIVGLPKDGVRRLLATAEDVAGNPMPSFLDNLPVIDDGVAALQIFIDTQGPRITDVNLGPEFDYDLFDPKPSTDGPTPLVHSLFIDVEDLPFRIDQAGTVNDFLYAAVVEGIAETVGNYELIGDSVGQVVIEQVVVHFGLVVSGQPARGSIELVFAEPLPDDRYTLTVRDSIVDPAGNKLDGESGAQDPSENPIFPTGDGVPGGDFVARFTIDSRPEIGVWAAGIIHIDTNGNFHFDPENVDFTNRDLIYSLGFSSDYIFAGNFAPAGSVADGFDKLAVYGRVGDQWRFLIDFDNDGVPDQEFVAPTINGLPVAGNFDGNAANGDEVGIFTGSAWYFDTNHDFVVDVGIASNYAGFPVVGDFDGDGDDDVATYIASQQGGNQFHIDLNTGGAGIINVNGVANHTFRIGLPGLGTFGFPGVRERPVAADMNGDGADDLGLWVPDGTAILPGDQGEWFFLLSDFERAEEGPGVVVTETVIDRIVAGGIVDFVPFSTTPFGSDLYARFGNSFALPIVGNFDPPVSSDGSSGATAPATTQEISAPVSEAPLAIPPVQQPAEEPPATQATTQATQSSSSDTTTPAASETDIAPATDAPVEPSSSDAPAATEPTPIPPEPVPDSPTSESSTTTATVVTTTTVAPTKVAVPTVTPAAKTTKSKTKSTKADTSTKPAKKLAVPALQSSSTNTTKHTKSKSTTTDEATNTSETVIEVPAVSSTTNKKTKKSKKVTKSTKGNSKLTVPEVSKQAKATKSTKSTTTKKTTVAPPSEPAVTEQASPASNSTKSTAAETKVIPTVVAAPQIATPQLAVAPVVTAADSSPAESSGGSVAATTVTMPIVESSTLAVAARPIAEVATLEPTAAASSVVPASTVQTTLTPAPVLKLKSAAAPIQSVQLNFKPLERLAVQSSVSNRAGSEILQSSSLSGTLSFVGPDLTASDLIAPRDAGERLLFEPALADAAMTDLLLTLADVTTDADDIAAERWTQPAETASESGQNDAGGDSALALAVVWDSI